MMCTGAYVRIREAHLDEVVRKLSIASPFVVWLFVVLAVRILADASLRLVGKDGAWMEWLLIYDCMAGLWIALGRL
jgi:hypothetical protein